MNRGLYLTQSKEKTRGLPVLSPLVPTQQQNIVLGVWPLPGLATLLTRLSTLAARSASRGRQPVQTRRDSKQRTIVCTHYPLNVTTQCLHGLNVTVFWSQIKFKPSYIFREVQELDKLVAAWFSGKIMLAKLTRLAQNIE